MNRRYEEKSWAPTSEELAAYAAGRLDAEGPRAPLARRIQDWLAQRPVIAAEVDAQRRLLQLWQSTAAPEPDEAAWAGVRSHLRTVPLGRPQPPPHSWSRRIAWTAAIVLSSAAAVWLAATLFFWRGPSSLSPESAEPFPVAEAGDVQILQVEGPDADALVVGQLPAEGPLPVATAEEIEIVRVNGADTNAVVVGELPVKGSLVLAGPGEVTLLGKEPEPENRKKVRMGASETPMIWASPEADANN